LHPDPAALAALPFSSLVVNVPLEFSHRNFAGLAGHVNTFVSRIALPIRNQDGGLLLASIRDKFSGRAHMTGTLPRRNPWTMLNHVGTPVASSGFAILISI
jgi:hypothetical protein